MLRRSSEVQAVSQILPKQTFSVVPWQNNPVKRGNSS